METPCEVLSVHPGNSGQPPIIVEFENGKINPDLPAPLKCKIFKDDTDHKKKFVTVESDNISYIGCQENSTSPPYTYLAVCNPQTHKAQLVRVESVRATAATGRSLEPLMSREDAVRDDSRLELSRKFGSKVSRRLHESQLKFHLVAKSDVHLQEVVQDKKIDLEDLEVKIVDETQALLPPCNFNAASPSGVYDIDDILTADEKNSLREGFDAKEAEEEDAFLKNCSPFFNALRRKCTKDADKMALLLYAEYLIRLCNKRHVKSYADICDCSEDVAFKITEEFTGKKKGDRYVSKADLDKAVIRIIIINLYLSDYSLEVLPLANSLRFINTSRIRTLVKVTGATFSSTSGGVATLTTPVEPFKLSLNPYPKKRRRT